LIESGESILLMGRPGLGKTTLLREMARVCADELGKRVVIVDTSNEIAGDGDVPHPAIGRARRMQVPRVAQQHDVMIEAVENHMPEVIVIDEIGRSEEALASRTIAERGVQLIATVHGNTLDNLLANPTMSDLIGGIQAVTLSDEEARRRGTQKTVLERKAPPTFDVIVEMISRDELAVRRPVQEVVDLILRGHEAPPETRHRDENGDIVIHTPPPRPEYSAFPEPRITNGRSERGGRRNGRNRRESNRYENGRHEGRGFENGRFENTRRETRTPREPRVLSLNGDSGDDWHPHNNGHTNGNGHHEFVVAELNGIVEEARNDAPAVDANATVDVSKISRVFPFGLSRSRLARAIKHLGLPISIARRWQDSDGVLMLAGEGIIPSDNSFLREAREAGLPVIAIRGNTYGQISSRLSQLYGGSDGPSSPREVAVREAQDAAQRVLAQAAPAELRPQIKPIRRLQHQLAERYHLRSYSVGREPNRRVRFLPRMAR
jgi:nucleoside-triphosphatase THEP1